MEGFSDEVVFQTPKKGQMKSGWKYLQAEELDSETTWSRKEQGTSEVPGKSVIFTLNQYEDLNVYSCFL